MVKAFSPLSYLKIKHSEKNVYDIYAPICASLVLTILLFCLPVSVQIFGSSGIVSRLLNLIAILSGFYIAALAAVATFDRPSMDEVMPGPPLNLERKKGKNIRKEPLTRRRFLSIMFGYLSMLSISIYLIGVLSLTFAENIKLITYNIDSSETLTKVVAYIFILLFSFLVCQLVSITSLGIYYLSDRIHREDPKKVNTK